VALGDDLYFMGFESYVPLMRERLVVKGKKVWRDTPLLGGYVMMRMCASWSQAFKAKDIKTIILDDVDGGELKPRLVPDREIQFIKSLEVNGRIGPRDAARFRKGDAVSVSIGSLGVAVPGKFQSGDEDNSKVLVSLLGADRLVTVPSGTLGRLG
jgi:transcription antitermination factor NusG